MKQASEQATDNTRDRILEATWKLLRGTPDLHVRIADIAAAAGVSRQAVYLHFGNRANLLLAAVRHQDHTFGRTMGFAAAALTAPVPDALGLFVRRWFDYMPHIEPVVHLLSAAAQSDPEARVVWDDRMSSVRALIEILARRLDDANLLRPPWTRQSATSWIWHQTHIDSWRHLVNELGWAPDKAVSMISATLERELLR